MNKVQIVDHEWVSIQDETVLGAAAAAEWVQIGAHDDRLWMEAADG